MYAVCTYFLLSVSLCEIKVNEHEEVTLFKMASKSTSFFISLQSCLPIILLSKRTLESRIEEEGERPNTGVSVPFIWTGPESQLTPCFSEN